MLENGALDGITVLDLSRLLPGPYCSMILADHGARVIAIEDRRFLADGLFFTPVNRNKEHMSLNLKTDEGREIFFQLVEKADVLLEGFRPGVVKRLGVDNEAVRAVNPGIIYCSITGFGQTGAFKNRAGHDVNYLSHAGVLDLVGEADRPPSIPGIQMADIAGGAMNAAIGILLALFARNTTGKGQHIDISMTDGMVGFLPLTRFLQDMGGKPVERGRWLLSHRFACYNTYETADNRYLAIGALENRFWVRLCEQLSVPQYGPLQFDEERRREIIAHLRKIFKSKPLVHWDGVLTDQDVCYSSVRTMYEVFGDPLFRERDMVVEIDDTDGKTHKVIGLPVKMDGTPGSLRTLPVDFGASTGDILKELGYTEKRIEGFLGSGVI